MTDREARPYVPCAAADVVDPDVVIDRDEELALVTWRCCGANAAVGSHGWKRYDDDDVFALHESASTRVTVTDPAPRYAPLDLERLREALAALEHERWAGWQRYVHARSIACTDGTVEIPASLVERWERLIATPYRELAEIEKDSDRIEADKTIAVLRNLGVIS